MSVYFLEFIRAEVPKLFAGGALIGALCANKLGKCSFLLFGHHICYLHTEGMFCNISMTSFVETQIFPVFI
jgi:hypothetical protein